VIYDKLCREDVLRRAYMDVRLNKGAPGVDEITFDQIENEVGTDKFLDEIRRQLIAKRYKPQAVRRVYIPKTDGKHDYASEEAQETGQRMEGPSAIVVLQLSRLVSLEQDGGR